MSSKKHIPDTFSHLPFKDLKRLMKKKKSVATRPRPLPVHRETVPDDDEIFHNAMKEVDEIREYREIPVKEKKVSLSLRKISASDEKVLKVLEEIGAGRGPFPLSDTQEYIEWVNEGYRAGIAHKLHRGHYAVRDYIDLHGLTLDDADKEVERFIKEALVKRHQCIKIIHGRGLRSPDGPVLKKAVIQWLLTRYRKYIVAFASARQCDGGLGAIYVLFK